MGLIFVPHFAENGFLPGFFPRALDPWLDLCRGPRSSASNLDLRGPRLVDATTSSRCDSPLATRRAATRRQRLVAGSSRQQILRPRRHPAAPQRPDAPCLSQRSGLRVVLEWYWSGPRAVVEPLVFTPANDRSGSGHRPVAERSQSARGTTHFYAFYDRSGSGHIPVAEWS